jgi:hypothetical protein
MRAAARLPIIICQEGDGFSIQSRVTGGRLVVCLTGAGSGECHLSRPADPA